MRVTTSEKNSCAMFAYRGFRKAKSTLKLSQVECGLGPGCRRQVDSRWWNSALSATLLVTRWGACSFTRLVYL
jgi:hypothetical protein